MYFLFHIPSFPFHSNLKTFKMNTINSSTEEIKNETKKTPEDTGSNQVEPPNGKYYESDSDSDVNAAQEQTDQQMFHLSLDEQKKIQMISEQVALNKKNTLKDIQDYVLSMNSLEVKQKISTLYDEYKNVYKQLSGLIRLHDQIQPLQNLNVCLTEENINVLNNYLCDYLQKRQFKKKEECLKINTNFTKGLTISAGKKVFDYDFITSRASNDLNEYSYIPIDDMLFLLCYKLVAKEKYGTTILFPDGLLY